VNQNLGPNFNWRWLRSSLSEAALAFEFGGNELVTVGGGRDEGEEGHCGGEEGHCGGVTGTGQTRHTSHVKLRKPHIRITRHASQVMLVMSAMRDEDEKLLRCCPYNRVLLLH
jgi:hypothetical protein